ncbi:hypothetical protein [Chlorogloeopsis sp. ULAP02]|uniref:hypothetical protein n=1 Tax=Chlorogloeopsis sp. ULAP02 TaxID=3107926 RepID=UPI0031356BDD
MRITPQRSRQIFGNPAPPQTVWEKQFDYFDSELKKVAQKDWRKITGEDLWYYFHDLAYVELQLDLFKYLFPICLNYWYETLMKNQSAACGDAEFHYSLYRGKILEKMMTPRVREAIYNFFHDGLIARIEAERGFIYTKASTPAYAWIQRFNSIGYVAPIINRIWTTWWKLDHSGKAVSAIMYASGLIYLEGENPIFGMWTPEDGGGGPYLNESDASIYDVGWLNENLEFLRNTLSVQYIQKKLKQAADTLQLEPEKNMAYQVAEDAQTRGEVIELCIEDLLTKLSKPLLGK